MKHDLNPSRILKQSFHVQETEHLKRLVARYGRGNWSTMIAEGTAEGDTIRRRTQVMAESAALGTSPTMFPIDSLMSKST